VRGGVFNDDNSVQAQTFAEAGDRPMRRAIDQTHVELARFIVDDANCVRFARSFDPARTPTSLMYPAVIGKKICSVVPEPVRDEFRKRLEDVRKTCQVQSWQFHATLPVGELRVAHIYPTAQPDQVAITVWAIDVSRRRDRRISTARRPPLEGCRRCFNGTDKKK
jgi:hypothetical protein